MKLEDVLKAAPAGLRAQDHLLFFLDGSVEPDHDPAYFRLYRNPQNRRSYLLVKKADVVGDLYEWTAEEMKQAGFVCAKVYRVPLMFGTELQNLSVTIHGLGETIPGDTVGLRLHPTSQAPLLVLDLDFLRVRAARLSDEDIEVDKDLLFGKRDPRGHSIQGRNHYLPIRFLDRRCEPPQTGY